MNTLNLPMIIAKPHAWNRGRIIGQKRPLHPKYVWAFNVLVELAESHRDIGLYNIAADSKLRDCHLI